MRVACSRSLLRMQLPAAPTKSSRTRHCLPLTNMRLRPNCYPCLACRTGTCLTSQTSWQLSMPGVWQ
jgi:hypothetical protein